MDGTPSSLSGAAAGQRAERSRRTPWNVRETSVCSSLVIPSVLRLRVRPINAGRYVHRLDGYSPEVTTPLFPPPPPRSFDCAPVRQPPDGRSAQDEFLREAKIIASGQWICYVFNPPPTLENVMIRRRSFLKTAAQAGALAALGDLGFLAQLPRVSAADATLDPQRRHPGIDALVRLLEETSRERVLEEVAARIKAGLSYRDLLAALLLAGVRNIQPRPVGFKFHAVLVVNSAHLASLASADGDRWLPIFWAIDQFKSSQAADVREGNWTMGPIDEAAVPAPDKARRAFIEAMENWDEAAVDAAAVGLARGLGAHEAFELFARFGCRDFREIGHKAIYVANSFRTLEVIGWHHAEPVLRSLAYALVDTLRDGNPSEKDLPADRPFRKNLPAAKTIRGDWLNGKRNADATDEMLRAMRDGSAADASAKTVELLNKGVAPQSIFDAAFEGAGELLMRTPGILALHAVTFTNAIHYAFEHCHDDNTRRLLLLQNAAFLPLFRAQQQRSKICLDEL